MSEKTITKIAEPAVTINNEVYSWFWNEECTQFVPAIERSKISVVLFPINNYQHFHYSPDSMVLREQSIKELGWASLSFDQPCPPEKVADYSLLSNALRDIKNNICERIKIEVVYQSVIRLCQIIDGDRHNYFHLYFNKSAYEFYHYLFVLLCKPYGFEPKEVKLNTLNKLMKWTISYDKRWEKLYKRKGFTWLPDTR